MNTNYSQSLSKGFDLMKKALFQPFDISKWINIGFTAFLAGLTDFWGGSSGGGGNSGFNFNKPDWDEFFSLPETIWNWLTSHPLWFGLILAGVFLLVIVSVVFNWISSRGKFMLLYNVVNNKDDVVKQWHDFRKQGNSIFWWQFVYGWLVFGIFILFFVYSFEVFKNIHNDIIPGFAKFGFIASIIITFIGLLVITGFISLFLNDFVVQVMYKYQISTLKAWSKFLSLLIRNAGSFIVYGLFILILKIATVIAVIFVAMLTCCIGLLLIMIPFVGTIILLPVTYTFRAFSIEYFATFGDEYNILMKNNEFPDEKTLNESGNLV